jgi:hypothetical protein
MRMIWGPLLGRITPASRNVLTTLQWHSQDIGVSLITSNVLQTFPAASYSSVLG